MDISGNTFGLGANVPFSSAHFDEGDAGAGSFQILRSGVDHALQHHMNVAARASPDARDVMRPWTAQVAEVVNRAEANVVNFLQADEETVPAVDRHRQFLRGLDTPGFLSSPSWLSKNIRDVVDHDAILADISGALGMSVSVLHEKIRCVMDLYTPCLELMDAAYKRLEAKLVRIETFSTQVTALRAPTGEPTPALAELQASLLRFIESTYAHLRIEEDYVEFCRQYDRFQTYRSILGLFQTNRTAPTCTVCMAEPVSAAVVPCGHTFCSRCCGTQRHTCYICRTPVRDRQRLYFG